MNTGIVYRKEVTHMTYKAENCMEKYAHLLNALNAFVIVI